MNRVAAWLLLACGLFLPGPATSAPSGFAHRTLANGLEVSVLSDSALPVVATRLWYHVGSANEQAHTRGFAHLFEHMMFGGTATHGKRDYWDHHHRFGGINNASTTFDETVYESNLAPAGFPEVLAMEADRMVNLRLDEETLANEQRIVTEELRVSTESSPWNRILTAALRKLFGEHPYSISPVGTKEDIAAATLEHSREFYARYYRPRNAHLVVVGPLDTAAVLAEVERRFAALPAAGETPPDVPSLAEWKFPERFALKENLPPAEIAVLLYPLPPPGTADGAARWVMNELLASGQVDRFEDDLVRRRGKAVYAGTSVMTMRRGGILYFLSAVLPNRSEAAQFRDMEQTVRNLARLEWLTEASLEGVKRRLLRRIENGRYYAGATADGIGQERWWTGEAERYFARAEVVSAVTRAEVAAAFERHVAGARPVRIYIQPEKVPMFVRLFGWAIGWFL